jgi:hypothetical protein
MNEDDAEKDNIQLAMASRCTQQQQQQYAVTSSSTKKRALLLER